MDVKSKKSIETWAKENQSSGPKKGILRLIGHGEEREIEYVRFNDLHLIKRAWISFLSFFELGGTSLKSITSFISEQQVQLDKSTTDLLIAKISTYNKKKIHQLFKTNIPEEIKASINRLATQNFSQNIPHSTSGRFNRSKITAFNNEKAQEFTEADIPDTLSAEDVFSQKPLSSNDSDRVSHATQRLITFAKEKLIAHHKITKERDPKKKKDLINKQFEADFAHKVAHTKVMLQEGQTEPTDEEIAACYNMSVHEVRAQRIADQFAKLCIEKHGKSLHSVEQIKSLDITFTAEEIATKLGIDTATLNEWLNKAEEFNEYCQEFTALATWFDKTVYQMAQKVSIQPNEVKSHLDRIEKLTTYIQNNISSFSTPLIILKLYNLQEQIKFIEENKSKFRIERGNQAKQLLDATEDLLGQTIEMMELHRQGSVWKMMQSQTTPKELREKIQSKTWGVSTFDITTSNFYSMSVKNDELSTPISNQDLADITLKNAKALLEEVQKASKKPKAIPNLPSKELNKFITESNDKVKAYEIAESKIKNVIRRQESRIERMMTGEAIDIPLFFHATPKMDVMFQVAGSGIRYSHATYNAAFMSTYPGMLRYGGTIIGLGSQAAFSAELSTHRHGKKVLEPGNDPGFNHGVLRDKDTERWIGFSDQVIINSKAAEVKHSFLQKLQTEIVSIAGNSSESIDQSALHEVTERLFSCLQENKLTFSLSNDGKNWTPLFLKRGKYEELSKDALYEALNQTKGYLQSEEAKAICELLLNNVDTLWKTIGGNSEGDKVSIEGSARFPQSVYFIGFDDEKEISDYFENDHSYQNRRYNKTSSSISQIREEAKKRYTVQGMDNDQKKSLEEDLDLFCVPLMEQIVEFECLSQSTKGAAILKKWYTENQEQN